MSEHDGDSDTGTTWLGVLGIVSAAVNRAVYSG